MELIPKHNDNEGGKIATFAIFTKIPIWSVHQFKVVTERIKGEIMINDEKIALKVGYCFCLVDRDEASHIDLVNTGVNVKCDDCIYQLYRGTSFEESQKIDRIMDMNVQYDIEDYRVSNTRELITR